MTQKSSIIWLDSLLRVSQSWNQGVSWAAFLSGDGGEESAAEFIPAVGRISPLHFKTEALVSLPVVTWESPSTSRGDPHSSSRGPFHLQPASTSLALLGLGLSLTSSSLIGPVSLYQAHLDNLSLWDDNYISKNLFTAAPRLEFNGIAKQQ